LDHCVEVRRDPSSLRYGHLNFVHLAERIRGLESAGVQDMLLATCDCDLAQVERLATDVVGRFERLR
jgi:hypothetical protein